MELHVHCFGSSMKMRHAGVPPSAARVVLSTSGLGAFHSRRLAAGGSLSSEWRVPLRRGGAGVGPDLLLRIWRPAEARTVGGLSSVATSRRRAPGPREPPWGHPFFTHFHSFINSLSCSFTARRWSCPGDVDWAAAGVPAHGAHPRRPLRCPWLTLVPDRQDSRPLRSFLCLKSRVAIFGLGNRGSVTVRRYKRNK